MPRNKVSAPGGAGVALAALTLALLMAGGARAQDNPVPTYQAPAHALPQESPIPALNGDKQHYVSGHFDAQGKYVAPHYESGKLLPFRGYFAADDLKRQQQRQQQRGYAEPQMDYTTPIDPSKLKPMEGRDPDGR